MNNQEITQTFIDHYENLIAEYIPTIESFDAGGYRLDHGDSVIDYFYEKICETEGWNSHLYETFYSLKNSTDFDADIHRHAKEAAEYLVEEYENDKND